MKRSPYRIRLYLLSAWRHAKAPAFLIPVLAGFILLGGAGCARNLLNVNFTVVGEQSALEKQVLGTYASLGEDLLVYSSVRGVDEDGSLKVPPSATDSQQAAFAAMRDREYNRDDIDALLAAGSVGETNQGLLEWRSQSAGALPDSLDQDQAKRIVEEENRDRTAILTRLMETVPGIRDDQREEVGHIFSSLNQEAAPARAWIQDINGSWNRK